MLNSKGEKSPGRQNAKGNCSPARNNNGYPKKSAYYRNKSKLTKKNKPAQKQNTVGNKGTEKSAKESAKDDTKAKKTNTVAKTEDKTKPAKQEKKTSVTTDTIFLTPPPDFSELAADIIRADCMNHGYRVVKSVGEGAYAKVKLAEVLPSKMARMPDMADFADYEGTLKVAIKVIEAKRVPPEFLKKFLPRELENHCPLPPHKNVARVFEKFLSPDRFYVVMEYCSGGDLLDLINDHISKKCKGLGEDQARTLFRMLTEGMQHIHNNGIVHRDLKCENILLGHEDYIKITDFGFSTRFTPGRSELLKTSCGSYAYTAPEVIKLKPYDGIKSDTWSLGIILFAMLNGRLPFNDVKLSELEEDMKMQRLRFERFVSYESMVLVRRILQYQPSSRPTTAEILQDPWLTGKKLIPRQSNKPTSPNNCEPHPPTSVPLDSAMLDGNTVYYKGTIPDRNSESIVTVNHDKNETVVLKSRAGNKQNIWIRGPSISDRPKTWPKNSKGTGQASQTRKPSQKSLTTVVVKHADTGGRKKEASNSEPKARVSDRSIQLSKWFMDKYMAAVTANPETKDTSKCKRYEVKKDKNIVNNLEPELCFPDNGDVAEHSLEPSDDFRFPSPVKNQSISATPEIEPVLKENSTAVRARTACARLKARETTRKTLTRSAATERTSPSVKNHPPSNVCSPEPKKTSVIKYFVNRTTSPAERIKYFRDRLMKLYDKHESQQNETISGLLPLLGQTFNLPYSITMIPTKEVPHPPAKSVSGSRQGSANSWRAGHRRSESNGKLVQRVIVHSPAL